MKNRRQFGEHRLSNQSLKPTERECFDLIAEIALARSGIVLPPEKAQMALARANKRVRNLGMASLEEYHSYLMHGASQSEQDELVFALTTNVTSFFRESHHFDLLKEKVRSELLPAAKNGQCIRIWSAGCSTGQEPYSIALSILEAAPELSELDLKVLATDIDPHVLEFASNGIYVNEHCRSVPSDYLSRYFHRLAATDQQEISFCINSEVKGMVSFRRLNLLENWPMQRSFQVVFCRNVTIYFDRSTQSKLWRKFISKISMGGLLFLGHSERIESCESLGLSNAGTTTYKKVSHTKTPSGGMFDVVA